MQGLSHGLLRLQFNFEHHLTYAKSLLAVQYIRLISVQERINLSLYIYTYFQIILYFHNGIIWGSGSILGFESASYRAVDSQKRLFSCKLQVTGQTSQCQNVTGQDIFIILNPHVAVLQRLKYNLNCVNKAFKNTQKNLSISQHPCSIKNL